MAWRTLLLHQEALPWKRQQMAACDAELTRGHRARRCPRPPAAATHGTALNWTAETLKPP